MSAVGRLGAFSAYLFRTVAPNATYNVPILTAIGTDTGHSMSSGSQVLGNDGGTSMTGPKQTWRGSLAGKEVYCPPPGLKGQQIMIGTRGGQNAARTDLHMV
jgi:hypothetical protein